MRSDGRPSRTASRVALRRAAHQVMDRPLVFDDPLALRMLRWDAAELLRKRPEHFEKGRYSRFLRAFLAVRSGVAEDVIAQHIARGTRQVVVLGAGLDTFAYRNAHPDVQVFEVDHPSTQAWKRKRLHESEIAIPDNVTFVPIDFDRQTLAETLASAGVDANAPTVFSWLGVTPYLETPAVWSTLQDIAVFSSRGGGVVFDYSTPPSDQGLKGRLLFWLVQRKLKRAGEPFKSYFRPDALADKLRALGFTSIEDLDGPAINTRYFANRTDNLRVGGIGRIVTALR